MKKSELKQIIKEEIKRILVEKNVEIMINYEPTLIDKIRKILSDYNFDVIEFKIFKSGKKIFLIQNSDINKIKNILEKNFIKVDNNKIKLNYTNF